MENLNVLETIDLCEGQYQARYNTSRNTIRLYLNIFQQMIFSRDLNMFLVWDEYLTIDYQLTLSATGYVNAITSDIGKVVTGILSGATATLISFNNTTKKWRVSVLSGTILPTEDVTITSGTGAGTLTSNDIFRGPYTISSETKPIRKMLGVTSLTDEQLFSYIPPWAFSGLPTQGFTDYGMFKSSYSTISEKCKWITGRIDNMSNTFTFLNDPVTDANYYRMVYYRDVPSITSETDDVNYLIPDRFRYMVVQAIGKLCEESQYGSQTPVTPGQLLAPYCNEIWSVLDVENAETYGENSDSMPFSGGM